MEGVKVGGLSGIPVCLRLGEANDKTTDKHHLLCTAYLFVCFLVRQATGPLTNIIYCVAGSGPTPVDRGDLLPLTEKAR